MVRLYADEMFPRKVSELLRTVGHDEPIYLELILDCSLIPTSRLTLKCKANSVSPLKWTGICELVYFSRLELLAREFILWRVDSEARIYLVVGNEKASGSCGRYVE
jgi:hypothetical protein